MDLPDGSREWADQRSSSSSLCQVAGDTRAKGADLRQAGGTQVSGAQGRQEGGASQQLRDRQHGELLRDGPADGGDDEDDEGHEERDRRAQGHQAHSRGRSPTRAGVGGLLPGAQRGRQDQALSQETTETPVDEQATADYDSQAEGLSASQKLSHVLSAGRARVLEDKAWSIVPQLFEGVVNHGRTVLMEVACSETSLLSSQIQEMRQDPSAALRCSFWNGCDLSTDSGVRLILKQLDLEQPAHVWLSPPCGPYSPLQNVNSRTETQRQELAAKREEAMRMYVGSCIIIHACVQRGIHVTLELSERCQAWRLPIFSSLQQKYSMYGAVSKGCRVGLRDRQGILTQKGWRILTTHRRLSELLELPCRCPKHFKHGKCEGESASRSELYTKEYARRAAKGILQEMDFGCFSRSVTKPSSCLVNLEWESSAHVLKCHLCLNKEESPPQHAAAMEFSSVVQGPSEGQDVPGIEVAGVGRSEVQGESGLTNRWALDVLYSKEVISTTQLECEQLAQKLHSKGSYQHDQCEQLLERVWSSTPGSSHQRNMLGKGQGRYLVFGAYSHGNLYGVTKRTEQFPAVVRYLLSYLQHWHGKPIVATSLVINLNCKVPIHRDVHNHGDYPNHLIALGNYQGGELWIEQSRNTQQEPSEEESTCSQVIGTGERALGVRKDIHGKVVSFPPKAWHVPLPWTKTRMTVGSYVTRGFGSLDLESHEQLTKLGFKFPTPGLEHGMAAGVGRLGPRSPVLNKEELRRQIYQLHAATGHGSISSLVNLLKKRNVDPEVIKVAQDFKCSVCAEKSKVQPRHLASLEPLPPKFHTVSTDIGHWMHPQTHEHVQFMLVIDEGSRLRVARILSRGSRQQPNAATCLQYLREGWAQYFGIPRSLRLDPAGAFRSQQVVDFCDKEGIFLDNTPADAHWQIGVCEQAIKGVKEVMTKICMNLGEVDSGSALASAVLAFNARDQVRRFSPLQHVFGRSPDSTDQFLSGPERLPEEFVVESATEELQQTALRRAEAEKAHAEWHASQRISRALNSKPRPPFNFKPGDLVYFWRTQEAGQSRRAPGAKHGRFLGPARVLATETRQSEGTEAHPAGVVWCVRGRNLIKCSPQQLRHASEREELLESLASSQGAESTPWTYTRVASEIGGNQFQDISGEALATCPRSSGGGTSSSVPLPRKTGVTRASRGVWPDMPQSEPATSSQRAAFVGQVAEKGEFWYDKVPETAWACNETCFWQDRQAAVEVEIEMPSSRKGWDQAVANLEAFSREH